jgi:hypothetical protein
MGRTREAGLGPSCSRTEVGWSERIGDDLMSEGRDQKPDDSDDR